MTQERAREIIEQYKQWVWTQTQELMKRKGPATEVLSERLADDHLLDLIAAALDAAVIAERMRLADAAGDWLSRRCKWGVADWAIDNVADEFRQFIRQPPTALRQPGEGT